MAKAWVIAETREDTVRPGSYELLAVARELSGGEPVTAVLIGSGVASLADQLAAHGADNILIVDDSQLEAYSPDGWAKVIAGLASERQPDVILGLATARGRELLPRIAAELGVGMASEATGLTLSDDGLVAERPIYAGKAIAQVRVTTSPRLATIRPNTFPPSETAGAGEVESVTFGDYSTGARTTQVEAIESERPDVSEADIIVGGGRGMGGPEHFGLVEALADELGAAVGASRAVVDAGWRPHGEQVGQTGKTVSPTLYIACGISGAVQHLAGMKTAKTIVAINKDPEAPVFAVADYGVVADVFDVLPPLTEAVRKIKGE